MRLMKQSPLQIYSPRSFYVARYLYLERSKYRYRWEKVIPRFEKLSPRFYKLAFFGGAEILIE